VYKNAPHCRNLVQRRHLRFINFQHLTPKSLIFLIELQVFAVVTSVATPCNKIWVVVNDDKQIEVHEKSDEFVLPTIQQYSLNVSFL
jgi:hypothetical protein